PSSATPPTASASVSSPPSVSPAWPPWPSCSSPRPWAAGSAGPSRLRPLAAGGRKVVGVMTARRHPFALAFALAVTALVLGLPSGRAALRARGQWTVERAAESSPSPRPDQAALAT